VNCDRRAVLLAGLAASVQGVAAGTLIAERGAAPVTTDRNALPQLDGAMHFDEHSRNAAANDFGHLIHRGPDGVLLPMSDQDIAATIRWAAARGRNVAPRGRGHSVFGRSQASDGIVIDMTRLRTVHGIEGDRTVVDAGATWSDVLAATLPQGLAPPALTDYLELSVGGTLVVGGVGGTISRDGMQTDNVLAMEVITGDGRQLGCSPDHNADLFNAVRGGLGQAAVISRATLRLVQAPRHVRQFLLTYPDLKTMLIDERVLAADGRFDAMQGAVLAAPTGGWTFRIDAAKALTANTPDDGALLGGLSDERDKAQPSTVAYSDYLNRLAALEQTLRSNGQWFLPHPWLTTFVGDSNVESVVGATLAELTPADLGTFGQIGLSAFRRRAANTPLLRLPADELCFTFNLIRIPTTDSATEADRLVAANRTTYERTCAGGGTLYPVSALPMSREDWRRHFGSVFGQLRAAKQKYDPGGVLAPGYEIF
jgi:cytokinin dehydrogenase